MRHTRTIWGDFFAFLAVCAVVLAPTLFTGCQRSSARSSGEEVGTANHVVSSHPNGASAEATGDPVPNPEPAAADHGSTPYVETDGNGAGEDQPSAGNSASIVWLSSLDEGLQQAKSKEKPVMVDFVATWCGPCHLMNQLTFGDGRIVEKAKDFVSVRIDIDEQPMVSDHYGAVSIPYLLFLSPDGQAVGRVIGFDPSDPVERVLEEMDRSLRKGTANRQ